MSVNPPSPAAIGPRFSMAGPAERPSPEESTADLFESLPIPTLLLRPDGTILRANGAALAMAGRKRIAFEGRSFAEFHVDPGPVVDMLRRLAADQRIDGEPVRLRRADGDVRDLLLHANAHYEDGRFAYARCSATDVTGHTRSALDELSHRAKNGMQLLVSLLNMAGRETASPEAAAALREAARRVAVIGAVQIVLHESPDPSGFDVGTLLSAVCRASGRESAERVTIDVRAVEATLPADAAMPMALALNELLANSACHGRNSDGSADIMVSFDRDGDDYRLIVQDGGPGFEPDTAARRRASGLGLVGGLARQLRGSFSVERRHGGGSRCTLRVRNEAPH